MNRPIERETKLTRGYGPTAEAPTELLEVMRQNSQAMDEMLVTTVIPYSRFSIPKED